MDCPKLKAEFEENEIEISDHCNSGYIEEELGLIAEGNESEEVVSEDDDSDEEDAPDEPDHIFLEGIDVDYLSEAVNFLQKRDEVNIDNALAINRQMQDMLQTLREKVISMINNCRKQYVENQKKMTVATTYSPTLKGIGNCGAPFFKDLAGKPCPPNEDYLYRSQVQKEFFPIDIKMFPNVMWTAADKLGILQGIKEQVIEHIERKQTYGYSSSSTKAARISKNVKLHTLILTDLLEEVDDDFTIDWNQISVYNLKSRHTANSCFAMWNVYLKPDINRGEWTEEENIKLNELAKKYKFQDWIAIAAEMDGRSDYQCFVQYQTVVSTQMREDKGKPWTKEEDERLLALVEKHRMGNVIRWNPICSQFPNRSKKQCFSRYTYSLNPNISRLPFTPEEDCIILAAVEEYGENFTCIPRSLFPNRTVIQIRNRYYNSIKCRETMRRWTPEDDETLLQLIAKYGTSNWKKISEKIKTHPRTSCRTRFLVISRFLKDNPDASIADLPRKNRAPRSTITKNNWMNKICEIKQSNGNDKTIGRPPVKPRQKITYRSRLRANELKWYNYLKYAYDYRFGTSFSKSVNIVKSHEFVRCALNVTVELPFKLETPYSNGTVRFTLEKLARRQEEMEKSEKGRMPSAGYELPPSYCLLLAFRALCIQSAECDGVDTTPKQTTIEFNHAVVRFRQRFHSLLYKTTLLSRLDPDTVVERTNFVIKVDHKSHIGDAVKRYLAEERAQLTHDIAQNLVIARQNAKRLPRELLSVQQTPEKQFKQSID